MANKFTTKEQRDEIVQLFEQQPEVDKKVEYYKESLLALDGILSAIETRSSRGYTTESFRFLGFKINKKINLDEYDKSKLLLEKKRMELELFEKKRYFEMWLERKKDYEKKFEELKAECEERYDSILEQAKEVSKTNLRLNDVIGSYKNEGNDMKIKIGFYLYIKQEVENALQFGKAKPKMSVVE